MVMLQNIVVTNEKYSVDIYWGTGGSEGPSSQLYLIVTFKEGFYLKMIKINWELKKWGLMIFHESMN